MKREDFNEIDDIFKESLESMDASPNENLWNKIQNDLKSENLEKIDEVFSDSLERMEELPSEKVWANVEKQLPLNLWVKRRLKGLSAIASV
ncbi:MAG: hypothetical protein ACPG5P_06820, partial [Saprospiraceae bacterium]